MSVLLLVLLLAAPLGVSGHGYIRDPPGRSTMWRDDHCVPGLVERNYGDNGLNCGGWGVHYDTNNGRCGVCGDPYNKEQENQPGGKYAKKLLARCYERGPATMSVTVEITANHLGTIELSLCENNNFSKPVTEKCLNEHKLKIWQNGWRRKYKVHTLERTIHFKVKMPDVTCTQCVMRWKYRAGNNYACDVITAGGETYHDCGHGKGRQETFMSCSDIAILDSCEGVRTIQSAENCTQVAPSLAGPDWTPAPVEGLVTVNKVNNGIGNRGAKNGMGNRGAPEPQYSAPIEPQQPAPVALQQPAAIVAAIPAASSNDGGKVVCRAKGRWQLAPGNGIGKWCTINCNVSKQHCPAYMCDCDDVKVVVCRGKGRWQEATGMGKWCTDNCPDNCPDYMCDCS